MEPTTLMMTAGICLFVFASTFILNFAHVATSPLEMSRKNIVVHLASGGLTVMSLLGLCGGFIWYLVE